MLRRVPTKELFFKIKNSPLRAIIENTMVIPERYQVLHKDDKFLGIKEIEKDSSKVFFIEHLIAYKCAKVFAESISSNINQDRSYTNDLENKAFIFLGESLQGNLPELHGENLFKDFDQQVIEKLHSYGFSPAVVVQNGYDYLDRTIFYLLVELPISSHQSGYLTIAKHKFKNRTISEILDLPQKKEEYSIIDVKKYGVPLFLDALTQFINKYEVLLNMAATPEQLTAVALDIFNKNRNIEALKSDNHLLNEIHKFIRAADADFSNKNQLSFLINFMSRLHFIDFKNETISPTIVNDILTEKKAYSNLDRLYSGKNEDEIERDKYIAEQLRVLKQIPNR